MTAASIARRRQLRDRLATVAIGSAGLAVLGLLLLMLWYLLRVVLPLGEDLRIEGPLADAGLNTRVAAAASADVAAWDTTVVLGAAEAAPRLSVHRDGTWSCASRRGRESLDGVDAPLQARAVGEGGGTLLLVDANGRLHRFAARAGTGCELVRLGEPRVQPFVAREFLAEARRPVVYLFGRDARLRVLHSVTGELLFDGHLPGGDGAVGFALDETAGILAARRGRDVLRWRVHNRYPQSTWGALWQSQWYGGYASPARIWHPDGESVGALSKYGLTPLLFGTFKAALYGMLIAVPLALGAAIYTGYFLSRRQRNRIKPAIELLEAFPTVVLGFLAGLWLAPRLAEHLLAVFLLPLLLVAVPLLLALLHLLLQRLSPYFVARPPRVPLLVLAYLATVPALFLLAPALEADLFDGSLRDWLLRTAGLRYEQRNALLVGLAMGLALLPTLFSIVEDAVFAVPRGLSDGSLALGATRWQSLSRVVLPAASPAILSALLIGFARGLGETMIVLLATGNTPILDYSALLGLRSVSASLAAELPEAAVGGVQFRILFLAALVLFAMTFVLNTLAELFRQRLRYRYAGR